MATPNVRELNGLVQTLTQGAQGQFQQIDTDIAANDASGAAQLAGLEAKKTRAFGDIEQSAQDKGMYFSGFSPDSRARYAADTYLPAVAQLQQTIASTRAGLLGKKADINAGIFNKAFDTQENDRAILADWEKMSAQQQFESSQADKQRAFEAQQNLLSARSSSKTPTAAENKQAAYQSLQQDIAGAFNGFKSEDFKNGSTEQVLAELMNSYAGDIDSKQISQELYNYRKAKYGV